MTWYCDSTELSAAQARTSRNVVRAAGMNRTTFAKPVRSVTGSSCGSSLRRGGHHTNPGIVDDVRC
jgi:predicted TIM-barrel enzyme